MEAKQVAIKTGKTPKTIGEWIRKGLRNRKTGEIIKLTGRFNGGRYEIENEDVEEFLRRLN
jgi:hypothetical protein